MGTNMSKSQAEYEYIVVGSGAGGGTVAARLAEAGRRVLLLEAGGDPKGPDMEGGVEWDHQRSSLPDDYDVPVFHAISTESDAMRWDFWVRHYTSPEQQALDPKYYERYPRDGGEKVDGVLYPRAGTLGGCTAHNAMILVYPHNRDWDDLAELVDDPSWSADNMRKY
jgi:choline dehydrogenase-like flavoprotein